MRSFNKSSCASPARSGVSSHRPYLFYQHSSVLSIKRISTRYFHFILFSKCDMRADCGVSSGQLPPVACCCCSSLLLSSFPDASRVHVSASADVRCLFDSSNAIKRQFTTRTCPGAGLLCFSEKRQHDWNRLLSEAQTRGSGQQLK